MREKKQMYEKKQNNHTAPDMSKMKPVVIDHKTRIYIPLDADPEEARARYWSNRQAK
jgi:hypothetical protein